MLNYQGEQGQADDSALAWRKKFKDGGYGRALFQQPAKNDRIYSIGWIKTREGTTGFL